MKENFGITFKEAVLRKVIEENEFNKVTGSLVSQIVNAPFIIEREIRE